MCATLPRVLVVLGLLAVWGFGGSAVAQDKPLIAIGGMLHESNTYSEARTGVTEFTRDGLFRGDEILAEYSQGNNEITGYIEGAKEYGFDLYPTIVGWAVPSGRVTDEVLDLISGEMIERLRSRPELDGLLLALHGAMVTESYDSGDAEVVRRLREAMGANFPIVVTHDFHANVSPEIVERSTALLRLPIRRILTSINAPGAFRPPVSFRVLRAARCGRRRRS